ncbi:Ecp2 effector protein [Panaeolus papilionaceus]|nr:Ecp2 effector protein [Panaeolus papilionaceus]
MVDRCWDPIYQNQSSGGSPLVSDCLQIAANIARDGEWTTTLIGQRQLVQYGTCAFGVEIDTSNKGPGFNFRVGNEDIITIINESIQRFQWFDKVGAMGFMHCVGNLDIDMFVKWGLYHT